MERSTLRTLIIVIFLFKTCSPLFSAIPGTTSYTSTDDTSTNTDLNTFQTSVLSTLSASTTKEDLELRINQLSTTITPLLTKAPYSLDTLKNALRILDSFTSSLKTIASSLTSSDARVTFINQKLSTLNTQRSTLNTRITKQQELSDNMQTTRNLPVDTSFQNKASQLSRWMYSIQTDTLDQLKFIFINDLGDLLTYAQTKGSAEQSQIRSLIANAMSRFKGFYTAEQQQQSSIFQQLVQLQTKASSPAAAAVTTATQVTATPAVATPIAQAAPTATETKQLSPLQTKIEDVKKRTSLNEKLIVSKELLNMVTESTTRDDRQSVFTLFKEIETGFLQMTKADIETLLSFLKNTLKPNTFMADYEKDIDSLITELAEAREIVGNAGTLLATMKTKIASFSTNASEALEAALYTFKLLEQGKLPPEEQKMEQPQTSTPIAVTPQPVSTPPPSNQKPPQP
jgi:hypothetical protein